MRNIIKSIVLFTLFSVILAIWVPRFIASPIESSVMKAKSSTIAGIEVGDMNRKELEVALTNTVNDWYTHNFIVSGGGSSIEVSSSTFQFDIKSTINSYEENYRKPWYKFWSGEKTVHLPLNILPNEVVKNEISNISIWDTDSTYEKVLLNASYLKKEEVEAIVTDLSTIQTDRISLSNETMPESTMGINELVLALNDTVVEPNMAFSMINQLGDAINLSNREAINFIASNLYNAALNSNGEIIERHSQNKIPSYLSPGLEAKVDVLAGKDLKFANTLTTPILLKLSIDGEKLLTEIYTSRKEAEVSISVTRNETVLPRTITRYSSDLSTGQKQQIQEGTEGLRVSVYRTVYGEQQLVSRDYYPPVNRIVVESPPQREGQNTSNNTSDEQQDPIDLDGDGFPDEDFTGGDTINDEQNANSNTPNEETGNTYGDENLPPGSYYDKGGNLITP